MSVGTNRELDLNHSGTVRTGQQGHCYNFDGNNDYVDCNGQIINAFTDFTFSLWVKTTVSNGRFASIKRSGANDSLVRFGINSGGGIFIDLDDGTVTNLGFGGLNDGNWYNVIFTYDADGGSDNLKAYVNGHLRTTRTRANFDLSNVDSNFRIGTNYNNSTAFYEGEMFDFRIYNDVLTPAEVTHVCTFGELGTDPGIDNLVLQYKMDEDRGETAYDSSGNGNNGTLTNITQSTFHSTQDVYSFQNQVGYNKRMFFDGSNDFVNTFDTSIVNIERTDAFKVSFEFIIDSSSTTTRYVINKQESSSPFRGWSVDLLDGDRLRLVLLNTASTNGIVVTQDTALSYDTRYEVELSYDGSSNGSGVDIKVDGTSVATTIVQDNLSDTTETSEAIQIAGRDGASNPFAGFIYDISFEVNDTIVASYQGYGVSDSDWRDRIGSNNGTVSGSPANVYLPRDESNTSQDVLGNTLQYSGLRPNNGSYVSSNCATGNGTDQYIEVPDNIALDITDNLTVCCWAKNDSSGLASTQVPFAKYDSGATKREWGIFFDSDEKFGLALGADGGGSPSQELSDSAITINDWHHYAATFEGGIIKLYVDGLLVPSTTSGTHVTTINNEDAPLTIFSSLTNGAGISHWNGNMLDARIYSGTSAPLTDANILDIYQNGTVDFENQTLAARYKLSEGGGITAYDSSGSGNHGTFQNAGSNWGTLQDNVHTNMLEGFSKRMYFDGTDDYVDIGSSSDFELDGKKIQVDFTAIISEASNHTILAKGGNSSGWMLLIGSSTRKVTVVLKQSGGVVYFSASFDYALDYGTAYDISATIDFTGATPILSGTINDLSQSVTIAAQDSGPFVESSENTTIGARDGGASNYTNGSIYDLSITVDDTLVSSYNGYGNADSDWVDQVNTNNGTVSGSPALLRIPATPTPFNTRMLFDGVDDFIEVTGMTASNDYFGACTISSTVYIADVSVDSVIHALGAAAYRLFIASGTGTYSLNSATDTGVAATVGYHEISVEYNSSGEAISLTVDGVEEWTGTAPAGGAPTTSFFIGAREGSGVMGVFFPGYISDFSITGSSVKNFSFNGYGNTNADWEDQVGSNNGTVNGSPKVLQLPTAGNVSKDASTDALTNPNVDGHNDAETQINFNPDSTPEMTNVYYGNSGNGSDQLVRVQDDPLLDITDNLTVSVWAKNDNSDLASTEILMSKYDSGNTRREWGIYIKSDEKFGLALGDLSGGPPSEENSDDAVTTNVWHHYAATFENGVVKLYIDGLPVSSSTTGTHVTNIYNDYAQLTIYCSLSSNAALSHWDGSIKEARIYSGTSAPLTDAQVLEVYNKPEQNLTFEGQSLVASYHLLKDTLDYSGNNLHGKNIAGNEGITFNKTTVPAAYSFGDAIGDNDIHNVFRNISSDTVEDKFIFYETSKEANSNLGNIRTYLNSFTFRTLEIPLCHFALKDRYSSNQTCLQVTRSTGGASDFTTQQVANGTLTTWVGDGNTGYVTKLYDLGGGPIYLEQSDTNAAPIIVSAGNLITENGNPAMYYNGTSIYMTFSEPVTPRTLFWVQTIEDTQVNNTPAVFGSSLSASLGSSPSYIFFPTSGLGVDYEISVDGAGGIGDQGAYYIDTQFIGLSTNVGTEVLPTETNFVHAVVYNSGDPSFPFADYGRFTANNIVRYNTGKTQEIVLYEGDETKYVPAITNLLSSEYLQT